MGSSLKSCECLACHCHLGTRTATRVCTACSAGSHPGLPKRQSTGRAIPLHARMYGSKCAICGAEPGQRCFRYQSTMPATAPEIQSGTGVHSTGERGRATPSRRAPGTQKG